MANACFICFLILKPIRKHDTRSHERDDIIVHGIYVILYFIKIFIRQQALIEEKEKKYSQTFS